ncbi:hypothetical protein GLAREA_06052 [Glarea lozoyensis ATCC 20868]|uniref:Uncharacterized protein n=1 Tax=Glarea lozoyensis (strain ATCC 20868 / MF5171) TaxID=1116229 RepID=S3D5J3_GLAL2|nr:uncharacterized protein GLAREA_06052 [Glarea lozoyensis ATCC 20868]EPE33040.1 hypothetical protein GLAREA_06052 [Glarea lozoyensis ATCC 20868]
MGNCFSSSTSSTSPSPPSRRTQLRKTFTKEKYYDDVERKGSDTRDFALISADAGIVGGDMEERKESASTIPGLTFDARGRPVWRGGYGSPIALELDLGQFKVEK